MEQSGAIPSAEEKDATKNEGNVIGGFKATLKNPNVSEEAKVRKLAIASLSLSWSYPPLTKEHAVQELEERGVEVERQ
jgi:hypothetical protein